MTVSSVPQITAARTLSAGQRVKASTPHDRYDGKPGTIVAVRGNEFNPAFYVVLDGDASNGAALYFADYELQAAA